MVPEKPHEDATIKVMIIIKSILGNLTWFKSR